MVNVEIRFKEVQHSKPIRNFVRQQLNDWLERNAFMNDPSASARMEIFRDFDKVACYVEARKGSAFWRNYVYGKGVHDAVHLCLKSLTTNTLTERSA